MGTDIFAPAAAAASFASAAQERLLNGTQTVSHKGLEEGLHTPAVRDLAWLMASAPLLSRPAFGHRLADPFDAAVFGAHARHRLHQLLKRLDAAPQGWQQALAVGAEPRLGRYAERLLAVWLEQDDGIELTATGLPVRDMPEGGRTLGECDALFRTAAGSHEHWELAVKFFLWIDDDCAASAPAGAAADARTRAHPASLSDNAPHALNALLAGCDAYVGAGLADRLDWKLRRLIEHQLPLSAHPALQALAPGPWQARMFVKGRLFYPLERWHDLLPQTKPQPVTRPDGSPDSASGGPPDSQAACRTDDHLAAGGATAIGADHPRGWWATLDTWLAWSEASSCQWTALARLDWLAPLRVDAHRAQDANAFAEAMRAHFASGLPSANMPRQVAALYPAASAAADTMIDATPNRAPRGEMPSKASSKTSSETSSDKRSEMSRGFIVPNEWPERARRFRRSGV